MHNISLPKTARPLEDLVNIQKERTKTLQEMAEQSHYFYTNFTEYDLAAARKYLRPVMQQPFRQLLNLFKQLDDWSPVRLRQCIEKVALASAMKLGKIAQPLRVAITGTSISPSIEDTVFLIGRDRVCARLDKALLYIEQKTKNEQKKINI